jgi:hypothetical protein
VGQLGQPACLGHRSIAGSNPAIQTIAYVIYVLRNIFAPWCNGSTEDFESFSLGSNPGGAAVKNARRFFVSACILV